MTFTSRFSLLRTHQKTVWVSFSHDEEQREILWLGSRVLSPAEANYSNIEGEALALVEAVKFFHKFIAGRSVTLVSDHRPLQYIFAPGKVPDRVSVRLQRWAITLRAYDYKMKYAKGDVIFRGQSVRAEDGATIFNHSESRSSG